MKRFALGQRQAVVIGGGVIGLEIALELRRYGLDVPVLEAMPLSLIHLFPGFMATP